MRLFNVIVSFSGTAEYEIEAENKDEAIERAEKMFDDKELWFCGDTVREPQIDVSDTVAIERRVK